MKKYRVNESEHFNLYSMYEHLKVLEIEMEDGERPWDNSIFDRIDEVETLMEKAYCVGALVDWPTLKRIREIQSERQFIRYNRCIAAGASEREAGIAFQI